jgi:hypothetical protein
LQKNGAVDIPMPYFLRHPHLGGQIGGIKFKNLHYIAESCQRLATWRTWASKSLPVRPVCSCISDLGRIGKNDLSKKRKRK